MTIERVIPLWHESIAPQVMQNKRVLVVSHMNSLRALIKYLSQMDEQQISAFNLPTATPLVYEFDDNLKVTDRYFDIDPEVLRQRQEAVAAQRKKRS